MRDLKSQKKAALMTKYPVGTRVKVISLVNYEPSLPIGSTGTVVGCDDGPHLQMRWDNGSSLALLPYEGDRFEIIK